MLIPHVKNQASHSLIFPQGSSHKDETQSYFGKGLLICDESKRLHRLVLKTRMSLALTENTFYIILQ
jgi:hypothetical protein